MGCPRGAFQFDAFQTNAFQTAIPDDLLCGRLTAVLTPYNQYRASLTPNTLEANGTTQGLSS